MAKKVTYAPCGPDVHDLLRQIIDAHRPDLAALNLDWRLLFAARDDDKPALTRKGMRLAGLCKVSSLKDRAEGKGNVTIHLDREHWVLEDATWRRSVLHHEIEHVDVYDGALDEDGEPQLRGRSGDYEFDGFHKLIELYGSHSIEMANLRMVAAPHPNIALQIEDLPDGAERIDADPGNI